MLKSTGLIINQVQNIILGGIRTRDLRIRSPTRYPLRYEDPVILILFLLRIASSVGGVKVSIVAFQAIDPGSIPGRRTSFGS